MSHVDPTRAVPQAPDALPDAEVIARVRGGDHGVFEIVMRRYNQRLYRVVRGIVKDDSEAEDVLQTAYVNAFTHLDQFAERATFATWLTRIAVYEALARLRRQARLSRIDDLDEATGGPMRALESPRPDPEQQASTSELRRLLERAIDALPDAYRTVFVLREIDGLSTADTASCLAIREETVKTRLHRARALLREELYDRAGVAAASAFQLHLARCDRVVDNVFARLHGAALTDYRSIH
jgi:RNA polymerase sigma-70 factor (ECF subfamily)